MAQPSNPDLQLVQKAVNGNRKAFTTLFNRYFQSVYNFALMLSCDPALAEDLTQEAFIKAYNSIVSFNEEYAFSTWLFKIATNNCIDFFRKRKLKTQSMDQTVRYKDDEIKQEYPDIEKTADKDLLAGEKTRLIRQAIDELPEKYRTAITLRHSEEKSYEDIAQLLELPLGTVKARIFRAREMLKKSLKDILF